MKWSEALGIGRAVHLSLLALGPIGYGLYRGVLAMRDVASGKFAGRPDLVSGELGAPGLTVLMGVGFFVWLYMSARKQEADSLRASRRAAAGLCVACGSRLYAAARFCGDCGAAVAEPGPAGQLADSG
jgi:hypothetical protein